MATFRTRGKRIQAQIRVKGAKPISASFSTLKQAKSWAKTEEAKLLAGISDDAPRMTEVVLRDALRDYGAYKAPLSQHGMYALRYALELDIADKTLSELTRADALDVKTAYLKRFSIGTASKYIHFINKAVELVIETEDSRMSNPFRKLLSGRDNKRWQRFTPEMEKVFKKFTTNQDIIDLVEFALETAMRRGEITNMLEKNVILEPTPQVYIPDTKTGRPRIIPLTKKALAVLTRRPIIDGRFFSEDPRAYSRRFERIITKAELGDVHFHDLRHEALSRWSAQGLNTPQLMQLSGHCSLASLSVYVNGTLEELTAKMIGAIE